MACLIIVAGQRAGASFPLKALPLVCGREATRDIQLLDPKVSRRHFILSRTAEDFFIKEDAAAKNGTVMSGTRIEGNTKLNDRDRIVAGTTELLFVITDDEFAINALKAERVFNRASTQPTIAIASRNKALEVNANDRTLEDRAKR